jgi:hypothetical protein
MYRLVTTSLRLEAIAEKVDIEAMQYWQVVEKKSKIKYWPTR